MADYRYFLSGRVAIGNLLAIPPLDSSRRAALAHGVATMFRVQRNTRLSCEALEGRDVPAGGITTAIAGGVLTITGDDYANVFTMSRSGSAVEIIGTDTLVNGSADPFRIDAAINSIKVVTLGGADDVSINSTMDFVLPGFGMFDMGDGANKLKLISSGLIAVNALSVIGGDGLDTVQVDGAAGSQIGTSALFQYAVGGSNTTLKHLAFPGAGQVTLAAGEGGDTLTMDDCQVKAVTFSGGYGQSSLNFKNGTAGPLTMNGSQGPASVAVVNATVTGNVKATGAEGIQVYLEAATITGNVLANGGLFDLDSAVGFTVKDAVSVTGNVNVKGYTTSINIQSGANLTVGQDIAWHATDALNGTAAGADISAKHLTLTSPRSLAFVQSASGSSLNLTGELTAFGRLVDLDLFEANVDKFSSVTGSAKASLVVKQGSFDQSLNVTSSLGNANLQLGGGPMSVVGNVYVSGKLTTSSGFSGNFLNNVTVNGGFKNDTFGIGQGTFSKNVTLNLKDGPAVVGIGNFAVPTVPDILGNLTITSGNGNDLIGFRCHVAGKTLVSTGGGSDTIWMYQSTFDGAASFNTGAGDDIFNLADAPFFPIPVTFNAKATIDAGAGNDTMILGKAVGDPNNGGGDANSQLVFAAGFGSSITGGSGLNLLDDEAGQVTGLMFGVDITGWADPT